MGQKVQSLTCSIIEKPHTGLDDCLRMLQACFRRRMSLLHAVAVLREYHDPRADALLPLLAAKVLEDHVAQLLELRVS